MDTEEYKDIFDVDKFIKRNLNDRGLSRDVATIFIDKGEEYISSIRRAIAGVNAAELRQHAHRLKGAAANFSLLLLCETAEQIEALAVAGEIDKAHELMPELEQRYAHAAGALRTLLISPPMNNYHEKPDRNCS